MCRGILTKTTNIYFHENSFNIFELLYLDGRTERKKNKNIIYLVFTLELIQQSQRECLLLLISGTERQSDCYVECVTVQHIECTDSVQCATELYLQ